MTSVSATWAWSVDGVAVRRWAAEEAGGSVREMSLVNI